MARTNKQNNTKQTENKQTFKALTVKGLIEKHGLPGLLEKLQAIPKDKASRIIKATLPQGTVELRGKADKTMPKKVKQAERFTKWTDRGAYDKYTDKSGNVHYGEHFDLVMNTFTSEQARHIFQYGENGEKWLLTNIYKCSLCLTFPALVIERYFESKKEPDKRGFEYVLINGKTGTILPLHNGKRFYTDKVSEVEPERQAAKGQAMEIITAWLTLEQLEQADTKQA